MKEGESEEGREGGRERSEVDHSTIHPILMKK